MIRLSKRAYSLLGLACNAGKAVSGYTAVSDMLSKGRAVLLLFAADIAENTVKKYVLQAERENIGYYTVDDPDLCACVGHPERKVLALNDIGFSREIIKEINTLNVGVISSNE